AVEAGEQLPELVVRYPDAGVADLDADQAVAVARGEQHRAAARRVLERVRDEVVEHLSKPAAVGFEGKGARGVEHEVDSLLLRGGQGRLDGFGCEFGEVGRPRV